MPDASTKKLDEIIKLLTSIRNLMILNLVYTQAPKANIARAAHIQKSKLYEIIPKQQKKKQNRSRDNDKNG